MKSVLYLGCPTPERADAEQQLGAVDVSVIWAENASFALDELRRRNMPVLLDLSRGAAALQSAREIRTQRAATLMFAVVDPRRPDLTIEAVLAGMADVFARPLGGRRVANAIERELKYESARDDSGGAREWRRSLRPLAGDARGDGADCARGVDARRRADPRRAGHRP